MRIDAHLVRQLAAEGANCSHATATWRNQMASYYGNLVSQRKSQWRSGYLGSYLFLYIYQQSVCAVHGHNAGTMQRESTFRLQPYVAILRRNIFSRSHLFSILFHRIARSFVTTFVGDLSQRLFLLHGTKFWLGRWQAQSDISHVGNRGIVF